MANSQCASHGTEELLFCFRQLQIQGKDFADVGSEGIGQNMFHFFLRRVAASCSLSRTR
jgi:hypothetical protein